MPKKATKPKLSEEEIFQAERAKKSEAYGVAREIAADLFPSEPISIDIANGVYDAVIVLDEDDVVDVDATTEAAADLRDALADEHIHRFALEIYGSESPLALLAAVDAEEAWFEDEGEKEEEEEEEEGE